MSSFKIEVIEEIAPNNEPVITSIPDRTIKVSADFIFQVAATDADIGDVLTYGLEGPPEGMKITPTGLIEWVPTKGQIGEHTVTVNVSDGKDHAITHFKITVEKKEQQPSDGGLDATMLGLLAVIIIVVVLIMAIAMMRKKGKGEEDLVEEEQPVEPQEEYPEEKGEEEKAEEPGEPMEEEEDAELEDEIDLDDLEDEGEEDR